MLLIVSALVIAALATAAPVLAQAPEPQTVILHAGQLLDRPGRPARGASTVVIRDGRVAEIRDGHVDAAAAGVPAAEVIDLRDHYVLPGLVDSHVHLTSDTGGVMSQLEEVQLNPAAKAYNALANARKTLGAGFTTVRNLGDRDGVTLALRDAIRADLIAVQGDPLRDVTVLKRVPFVMKDGAVFKDERRAK